MERRLSIQKLVLGVTMAVAVYGIIVTYQLFATYREFYMKHTSAENVNNIAKTVNLIENSQMLNQPQDEGGMPIVNFTDMSFFMQDKQPAQDQSGQSPGLSDALLPNLLQNTGNEGFGSAIDTLAQGEGQGSFQRVDTFGQSVDENKGNVEAKSMLPVEGLEALETLKRPIGIHKVYQCYPKTHVKVTKVHRCASTTVGNIILTFAFLHDLSVATPSVVRSLDQNGDHLFKYDVITQFGYQNDELLRKMMDSDVISVGFIRNPLAQYVSSLHYHRGKIQSQLQSNNFLKEFMTRYQILKTVQQLPPGLKRNNIANEFGFREEDSDNEIAIQEFMERVVNMFDIVILVEYFDESLVLMKRMLCWDFQDIVYESRLTSQYSYDHLIDNELLEMHRNWSSLNYKLYDYFQQRFVQQVQAQGKDFFEEVKMFKKTNEELSTYCKQCSYTLLPHPATKPAFHADATPWSMEMTVTCPFCWIMKNARKVFQG
ncbi:galactose-3-O-sulfotransferase 2 [Lingula anatina]|uniref:Galactose-3-O-sulfotransferase 2 n=1 Tax=Lingula anatina TaxID=7574 RepID=A0A1S3H9K5_LINAN|nr:galactose-3-O-sulfotransferase 2 [Lingula anatina]|eukprot:XP_013382151.1 galactose-3-O-sulfotransferase 2 [Lingula anatina]